jgi:hypothetical protein
MNKYYLFISSFSTAIPVRKCMRMPAETEYQIAFDFVLTAVRFVRVIGTVVKAVTNPRPCDAFRYGGTGN